MKNVDLQIDARWIATVEDGAVLEYNSVIIDGGVICDICPTAQARLNYQPSRLHSFPNGLLTPGFVNLHNHCAMTLMRGVGTDLALMDWLNDAIWPMENAHVDHDMVALGARWSMAEMLSTGTTTFSDQYFYPEAVAAQAIEMGMRCQLATPIIDFPTAWAKDPAEGFQKTVALHDKYKSHPRVHVALGPHAPYTISDATFNQCRTLADQLNLRIQCHVQETQGEVDEAIEKNGQRPIARLEALGLLGPDFQAVHVVALNDQDIETLARYNVSAVTCPDSNMKLASGFARTRDLWQAGVNLCIGTDGAASNNDQDLLSEARSATLAAKGSSGDATALNLQQTLQMMTLNGARALGLEDQIGSIKVGKQADLVAFDLSDPFIQPLADPLSALFYTQRAQVDQVWIDGQLKVDQGRIAGLDIDELVNAVKQQRKSMEPQ
ncbi:MAG: TRZ/ATZ family hydrolase [Pseudomonadales bacterium]